MFKNIDKIDQQILTILQKNSKITNVQLAQDVGISAAAMLERIKKLEHNKIIQGYAVKLGFDKLSLHTHAIITISLESLQYDKIEKFRKEIELLPEIVECYQITGVYDFYLKVITTTLVAYQHFLTEKFSSIEGIKQIQSSIVLHTLKFNSILSIPLLF